MLHNTPIQHNRLQEVARILKSEFFGIDEAIDSVISYISAWYCLPKIHEKPVVINLWGLTGVGKTSLVLRLIELLELEKDFVKFDFSNQSLLDDFPEYFANLSQSDKNGARVFLFDEFQNIKSTDDKRGSMHVGSFFDWLDTGVVHYHFPTWVHNNLITELKKLKNALDMGCKIKNGVVVSGAHFFQDTPFQGRRVKINPQSTDYMPATAFSDLVNRSSNPVFRTSYEMVKHTQTMNGRQLYAFMEEQIKATLKPAEYSMKNCLVFIAGNLDEAFQDIIQQFDKEVDADTIHESSKKKSLSSVKDALLERLRPEYIARLGNNHVLYPALPAEAYRKFIRENAFSITHSLSQRLGVKFIPTEQCLDIVYKEGVFPSQGLRPVKSTLYSIFMDKFPPMILKLAAKIEPGHVIEMDINEESEFSLTLKKDDCIVDRCSQIMPLEYLTRKAEKDSEITACVAVHEAGHAIVQVALTGSLPKKISCKTSSDSMMGYVTSNIEKNPVHSKTTLTNKVAVLFGGMEAERLVFGQNYVSLGASHDLMKATQIASNVVRRAGLGSFSGIITPISSQDQNTLKDHDNKSDAEINEMLDMARDKASEVLNRFRIQLGLLSHMLFEEESLNEERICKIFMSPDFQNLSPNQGVNQYHSKLIQFVNEHNGINLQEALSICS